MTSTLFTARRFVTMDPTRPVADAVAVRDGRITAVGTLEDCRAAAPDAAVRDLGDSVVMPGFIDVHTHPQLSGMATIEPAINIAPWLVSDWDGIVEAGRRAVAEQPEGASIMLIGLDQLLHGCPFPTAKEMDEIFGDRIATIIALCQHQAAITTATMRELGWLDEPPADPVGGTFGRAPDGTMLGTANEIPAVFTVIEPVFRRLGGHPLTQAARYMAEMASVGITSAAETGYVEKLRDGYLALCGQPSTPMRLALYEQLTEPDPAAPFESPVDPSMLCKLGVKIFADGTPWLGTTATSFPYLDTEPVRRSGFPMGLHPGEKALNYDRATFDALLEPAAAAGLQVACHVNGDLAIDFVLDAYQDALDRHGLSGTDHRWRVEHIGAVRTDQLERMAEMGVVPTFGLFQFMQWGDVLDGQMYAPEHGAEWCRIGDAERLGLHQSYHNDGSISRPLPLANVQAAVTRRCNGRDAEGNYVWAEGAVHGPAQKVSLEEALRGITINAAYCLGRDDELGSIEVGKYADFVELSEDPHDVEPERIVRDCQVRATWLGGKKVDPDRFVADISRIDPTEAHHETRSRALGCHHR
jgi:predicted amidohydrolase YtcJ